jgi:hypothetical protein
MAMGSGSGQSADMNVTPLIDAAGADHHLHGDHLST